MAEVPSIRVTQQDSHAFLCNVLEQTASSLETALGLGWDLGLQSEVGAREQLILNYISTIGFSCRRTNTSEFKVIEPISR